MEWVYLILVSIWIGFCCFGIVNPLRFGLGKGENSTAVSKSLIFAVILVITVAACEIYPLDAICYGAAGIVGILLGIFCKPSDDASTPPDGCNPPTCPPHDVD